MALATLEEFSIWAGQTFEPVRAQMLLEQASAAVRTYCGWHIAPSVTETVTVDGSGGTVQPLPTLHLTAVTAITEDATAVTSTDFQWSEAGFLFRHHHWTTTLRGIAATITHGYATVPPEIQAIVMMSAARAWASPMGVVREQIGDYSATYSQAGSNQTGGIALLGHELTILNRYALPHRA